MTAHPAKFSDEILERIRVLDTDCPLWPIVLDPFAGTGKVHRIDGIRSIGVEIEPEWAHMNPCNIVANTLYLPFKDGCFEGLITSPCYGNRHSDHHQAKDGSRRHSYTHTLGRTLHPDNAGTLHWGDAYRFFHDAAWTECLRVLKPGADVVINISNHIRGHVEQRVVEWHLQWFCNHACTLLSLAPVETKRLREGANYQARVRFEYLLHFRYQPGRRHDPPTRQMGTTMLTPGRASLADHVDA